MEMDSRKFSNLLDNLRNRGEIAILQGGFVLHKNVRDQFISILKDIGQDITIGNVRDVSGSSRKFILPLLEYLDSIKVTRRVGDKRVLLQKN
jgi:selenocysteine-specific elongation factor